jgi:cytochrome c
MDQFEFTKIAAAILLPLLLIFGFKTVVETRMAGVPVKPGYMLPGSEPAVAEAPAEAPAEGEKAAAAAPAEGEKPAEGATAPAEAAQADAPAAAGGADAAVALLAKADAEAGKGLFSKCKACHTIEKGKPKGVGPNLFGVVNRPKAASEGFDYSAALKAKGGEWNFANLAAFITNPKAYVAGTKMVFNGLSDPQDVANLIAYLAQQHEPPVELPK